MSRFKKNNPGCCGCEGLPCGPSQVICNNFSPRRSPEYFDITISGIPDIIERDRLLTPSPGTRENSLISGLAQANGTYRVFFDFDECKWVNEKFTYTITQRCRTYFYTNPDQCSTAFPDTDNTYNFTLEVFFFGGTGGGVGQLGTICLPFIGFNFPNFEICNPEEQTETVTVSYNQCIGGSIVSTSYTATITIKGSYVLL